MEDKKIQSVTLNWIAETPNYIQRDKANIILEELKARPKGNVIEIHLSDKNNTIITIKEEKYKALFGKCTDNDQVLTKAYNYYLKKRRPNELETRS